MVVLENDGLLLWHKVVWDGLKNIHLSLYQEAGRIEASVQFDRVRVKN